jgi:hypothetical protein
MHDARELHMLALKSIMHYLQGTLDFDLHLLGMQSSLVTISSPGPPSIRTQSLAPA